MQYSYSREREKLFTEDGSRDFVVGRDLAFAMLKETGAFRQAEFIGRLCTALGAVDTWFVQTVLDRMIELKELVALRPEGSCWAQFQIYASPKVHNYG